MLNEKREHVQKLPGVKLPDSMVVTTDLEGTVKREGLSGPCRAVTVYEEYSEENGSFCGGGTDHC